MGLADPHFPMQIWDGSTPNTQRTSIFDDVWPNHQDWDQIREEVIAVQEVVNGLAASSEHLYLGQAHSNIAEGRCVRVRTDGSLEHADPSQGAVDGIAAQTVSPGQMFVFITGGRLTLNAFALVPGTYYYLAASGNLVIIPPTSGFVVRVGRAITNDTLDIRVQDSIRL